MNVKAQIGNLYDYNTQLTNEARCEIAELLEACQETAESVKSKLNSSLICHPAGAPFLIEEALEQINKLNNI